MTAYYSENDKYAAQWLRNLIAKGHIPADDVDERSIVDVRAEDLRGYNQCHFFAGIGGWPLALRMAGWPDDRPVWTGSCPCQPFSNAGKRKAGTDPRHLWPVWFDLIKAYDRRFGPPAATFGEQVGSSLGREWLAGVRADMEGLGRAFCRADLCAASKGAPHIRQRLWWMAHADGGIAGHRDLQSGRQYRQLEEDGRSSDWVEHAARNGQQQRWSEPSERSAVGGRGSGPAHEGQGLQRQRRRPDLRDSGSPDGLVDHHYQGLAVRSLQDDQPGAIRQQGYPAGAADPLGAWSRYDVVHCTDGKARRFESFAQPVVDGFAGGVGRLRTKEDVFPLSINARDRVGRLRGYGNAIVAPLAAEFIIAALEAANERGV